MEVKKGVKMKIPIDEIRPNPDQPRKRFDEAALQELASSIREEGIIVPLLVRPVEEGYQIVHGERRLHRRQILILH